MSSAMSRLIILSLLGSIAKSFLITETVELILGWLLGVRTRKGMLLVFLANLMTNPADVLIFSFVGILAGNKAAAVAAIPIEIAVLFAEWRLYFSRPDMLDTGRLVFSRSGSPAAAETASLFLSLLLNVASYGLGALISAV